MRPACRSRPPRSPESRGTRRGRSSGRSTGACGAAAEGEVLRCHDLRATDAAGRDLPAAFAIRKNVLVIRVDDREAAYPVTIDPIFTGSTVINGARFSNFGYTVAGAGDVNHDGFADVVVGAPYYQRDGYQVGRAYLFKGSADGLVLPAACA